MPIRALEFYCGIGGLHRAFSRCGVEGSIVQAFDWDPTACQVYAANHSPAIVEKVDISSLTAATLASFRADLWLLSPACQPYTVLNSNAKGESDPRAASFLHLIQDVLPELATESAHPSRLLVENVAGFEASNTRQILLSTLRSLGYTTLELLLTPLQYGIPNSRLRYYLLAKLHPMAFSRVTERTSDKVWRCIPGHPVWVDHRLHQASPEEAHAIISASDDSVRPVKEYLDYEHGASCSYPIPDQVLRKYGRLFDIVLPSSRRTCCFTRGYTKLVERTGSVLQTNETLDTTETFNQFLQAPNDPQSVEMLRPLGLRYFSPTELLRIFDFIPRHSDSNFHWTEGISTKTKYRLIGNSVNVTVVKELLQYLFDE